MKTLIGYVFIAFSVVLFFALLSFDPADSSLLTSNYNHQPDNLAGAFGVWLAAPLVVLYGRYAAFLLNFGLLTIGINLLVRAKIGRILIKTTLFFISAISLSVVLAVVIDSVTYLDAGMIGIAITKSLSELINKYVILILFSVILFLSLSSTMKLFQKITFGAAKIMGLLAIAPFQLLGLVVQKKETRPAQQSHIPFNHEEYDVPAPPAFEGRSPFPQDTLHGERGNVPDFLRTDKETQSAFQDDDGRKHFVSALKPAPEEHPSWLQDDKEKDKIMRAVRAAVNKELGEPPADEPLEVTESLPVLPEEELPSADAGKENTEIEETPPEVLTVASAGAISDAGTIVINDPFIIEDLTHEAPPAPPQEETPVIEERTAPVVKDVLPDDDAEVEIAGEADYAEEAKSRKKQVVEEPAEELFAPQEIERSDYVFPEAAGLEKSTDNFSRAEETQEIEKIKEVIENTFGSFKIDIHVSGFSRGPAITRYEIVPPSGLKLKNIVNLTDDLALNLGTRNIRIVAPIGNKSIIGVEVPNKFRRSVVLREIIESDEYKKSRAKLPLVLGKDIAGNIVIEDLADMPHLLIAGTTGSGKSVYVNSLIGGIVFARTSEEVKFIFIDPKMVELELYNGIPHLLAPVITNPEEAIAALEWTSAEMDRRYKILSDFGVRNITDYNKEAKKASGSRKNKKDSLIEYFPYIVVVIDEFANLMLRMPRETEKVISRLAAMARAVGIHLVVATQRPSVDVVTGIIKANFPSRIAFRVSSQTDARTILDKAGAEKLLGRGDMLFMTPNFTDMIRIQTPYVSNTDVESVVRELKRNGTADYTIDLEELMQKPAEREDSEYNVDYREDPLFADSLKAAIENGEVSASYLQRRFRIGYNRASRIMDSFEKMKILGPARGAGKAREVTASQEDLVHYLDGGEA